MEPFYKGHIGTMQLNLSTENVHVLALWGGLFLVPIICHILLIEVPLYTIDLGLHVPYHRAQ